jgi:hypothetical protein
MSLEIEQAEALAPQLPEGRRAGSALAHWVTRSCLTSSGGSVRTKLIATREYESRPPLVWDMEGARREAGGVCSTGVIIAVVVLARRRRGRRDAAGVGARRG